MAMDLTYPDGADMNKSALSCSGRFAPNGAGAIDNTANIGRGFTVARTAVGKFTLQLLHRAYAVLHAEFSCWDVALAPSSYDILDCVQGSDGTWTLTVQQVDLAVPAAKELAVANAKTWISFRVDLQLVKP